MNLPALASRQDPTLRSHLSIATALARCPVAAVYRLVDVGEPRVRGVLLDSVGPAEAIAAISSEVPGWRLLRERALIVPTVGQGPAAPETAVLPSSFAAALISVPLWDGGQQVGSLVLVDFEVRPDFAKLAAKPFEELASLLQAAVKSAEVIGRRRPRRKRRTSSARLTRVPYDLSGLAPADTAPAFLDKALDDARRGGPGVTVARLALDRFQRIHDWLGRTVSDELIVQVAQRLTHIVRESDLVTRHSTDEVLVILREHDGPGTGPALCHRMLQAVEEPFFAAGHDLSLAASLGMARGPGDADEVDSLLRFAGIALREARHAARRLQVFTPAMRDAVERRGELERRLRQALGRGELRLHYQPKVCVKSSRLTGVEALIRWQRGDRMVSPGEFIPVAEESGLIVPIGAFTLLEGCRQARRWLDDGVDIGILAVNVSPHQFSRPDFVGTVRRALGASQLPAERLELEVTEGSLMSDIDEAAARLGELRQLGIGVAVDDFGTGYSSLAYLQRLPVDRLKIDRAFVKDLDGPPAISTPARALTGAIVGLAHALELKVLAEGVETEEQLGVVLSLGCEEVQGFYFSKPLSPDEIPSVMGRISTPLDLRSTDPLPPAQIDSEYPAPTDPLPPRPSSPPPPSSP